MDDRTFNDVFNRVLQNVPNIQGPSRMPTVPISSSIVRQPALVTSLTETVTPINTATSTTAGTASPAPATLRPDPRIHRRFERPYNLPASIPVGTTSYGPSYGGAYNNGNYSYNRPYPNMAMGANYNLYNSYGQVGQPLANQFQNPVIIAAAENSRPAFETIHSVVQSFNAVSIMLESTLNTMHMSFQALLGVAENFTRLRMFMMKLYSTIVSFKLAKWFLTKIYYLLRMVRGGSVPSVEDDLWSALSIKQVVPSEGRSWPLVVFTGLLAATPYFVYRLLNSATPEQPTPCSTINGNKPAITTVEYLPLVFMALNNWNHPDPKTISLVKGTRYLSSTARVNASETNGGWLLINDSRGKSGFVPVKMLTFQGQLVPQAHPQSQHVQPAVSNVTSNVVSPIIPEQIQPLSKTSPIIDLDNNPIMLPHPLLDRDKLENDV